MAVEVRSPPEERGFVHNGRECTPVRFYVAIVPPGLCNSMTPDHRLLPSPFAQTVVESIVCILREFSDSVRHSLKPTEHILLRYIVRRDVLSGQHLIGHIYWAPKTYSSCHTSDTTSPKNAMSADPGVLFRKSQGIQHMSGTHCRHRQQAVRHDD